MTTDKIIDAKYFEDKIENAIDELIDEGYIDAQFNKYGDLDSPKRRKICKILEKHLHPEPEKEGREGICKVCGKEGMYLETDNIITSRFGGS